MIQNIRNNFKTKITFMKIQMQISVVVLHFVALQSTQHSAIVPRTDIINNVIQLAPHNSAYLLSFLSFSAIHEIQEEWKNRLKNAIESKPKMNQFSSFF